VVAGWLGDTGQALVLKLDQYGNVTWQNVYGDAYGGGEVANFVVQTPDRGYAVSGISLYGTAWLLKLDQSGTILWDKYYPGSIGAILGQVSLTNDGGFIVAGYDGAGLALRLNSTGDIVWSNSLGGTGGDIFNSAQATSDGGYVLAGHDFSFGDPNGDMWVVKLNSQGHCCHTVTEQQYFTITEENTSPVVIPTSFVPIDTNIPATTTSVTAVPTSYGTLTQCPPVPP
jgi:outer membrane protein assembly factor BamB